MTIEPGLYRDLSEAAYHSDPDSLSVSGAKKLLPPSCPAKFKAAMEGGEEFKDIFDFGKAAHKLVLGEGATIEVAPFDNWTTKAAKEFRAEAREAGKAPILAADYVKAEAMAEKIRHHETASALFSNGSPEVSAFWDDPATGVRLRARFDWLPDQQDGRRLIIPDYKTAASAHPDKFSRHAADYGYHLQATQYTEAAETLLGAVDPLFLFVVQEKEPPYEVNVIPLHENALRLGRALNDKARRIYRECVETGHWPGYTPSDQVAQPITLPAYYAITAEEFAIS